jgi:hypothetical protein
MTAPLTGKADTPDVPASPMPVATKPANKIVRIVMSPSIVTVTCVRPQSAFSLCAFFLMSPDSEGYLLAGVIDDIMIAVNLVFSTSQAFICCSFTDSILALLIATQHCSCYPRRGGSAADAGKPPPKAQ